MDVFSAATDVTFVVPLQDKFGNALTIDAIAYRMTDESGVELVPQTTLDQFVAGSPTAEFYVPAAQNTLPVGAARALRSLELICTTGPNQILLHASYVVQAADPLVAGVNSFATYAQVEFTALSLPNLDGWAAADEDSRVAALIDARAHIVQLSFTALNSNVNWGQDSLNYVPEGAADSTSWLFSGNLDLLLPEQFAALPARFVDALKKAQVVEADSILGGNGVEQKRREGLIQDNVGESRQTFRAGKPLELPVCRRALGYLSYFITFSKRIGRA